MKLCVPIIDRDVDSFIEAIGKVNGSTADVIELRIDYLDTISAEVLDKILSTKSDKPYILTIRSDDEGGKSKLDEKKRLDLFLGFQDRVDFIDVEYAKKETLKSLIAQKKCRVIVSMHDFEKTPTNEFLNDYIQKAFDLGADIAKFAVMCTSYDDSIRLLELMDTWKDKNVIIIGMGQYGTLTRILSPLFNPYLTFVSLDLGSESAPGQITLAQMRKFLDLLKKNE